VLDSGNLYVAANDGYVYMLDPENGNTKQKTKTDAAWATPLVTDNDLIVATTTGKLWKLNLATLEPEWDTPFKVDAGLLTSPVLVNNDTIVVGGIGKELYGVDLKTGAQKWAVS